jgi:hypothetical protein
MVEGFIPQSSLLLGIIPALVLLYISIKDWQGKFVEKTLFIIFIIGIFIGFIVSIVQLQFMIVIEILIIYPFLEQIVKTMVLNLRRFQEKQSTIIYGLALGLGFGSIYPPASMMLISAESVTNQDILMILLGSIGLLLLHGATGAMIGYGIYQKLLPKYYLFSVVILIIGNVFKLFENFKWINLIFGIILFWYVHKSIIKKVIKTTEKRIRSNIKS